MGQRCLRENSHVCHLSSPINTGPGLPISSTPGSVGSVAFSRLSSSVSSSRPHRMRWGNSAGALWRIRRQTRRWRFAERGSTNRNGNCWARRPDCSCRRRLRRNGGPDPGHSEHIEDALPDEASHAGDEESHADLPEPQQIPQLYMESDVGDATQAPNGQKLSLTPTRNIVAHAVPFIRGSGGVSSYRSPTCQAASNPRTLEGQLATSYKAPEEAFREKTRRLFVRSWPSERRSASKGPVLAVLFRRGRDDLTLHARSNAGLYR